MAAVARALSLLAALCLAAFANVPRALLVAEKPHQGGGGFALASHRGPAAANALNAPGLCGCLYDSGGRSRSTGKERDAETGLDYFGARYMAAVQGRFTSPDAPFADQHVDDPQSWNLYGYVRNRPLSMVDHDGNAAAWAIQFQREGSQLLNTRTPSGYVIGGALVIGGAIGMYATDAETRRKVNTSASEIGNAILEAAARDDGFGSPDFPRPFLNENTKDSRTPQATCETKSKDGTYSPDRPLPVDKKTGNATPEKNPDGSSAGPHTQLGKRESSNPKSPGKYTQGREFDASGKRVKDIDFTDHGRRHPDPHQHSYDPKTGKRGPAETLEK